MSSGNGFINDPIDADLLFNQGGLEFGSFLQNFPMNEQEMDGMSFSIAEMAEMCAAPQDIGPLQSGVHFQHAFGMVGVEGCGQNGVHGFGDPTGMGHPDETVFGHEFQFTV
jgi:hypothetical protein